MTDTNNNTNENEKSDWSQREIGALWKREGRNQKYLTGKLKQADGSEQQVVIFSNKNKTKDNQPDFRVYKSEPRQDSQESQETGTETEKEGAGEQEDLL